MEAASQVFLQRYGLKKGRPQHRLLRYHVQAAMLLLETGTDVPVTASPTTNSEYEPQMTSRGAKVIERLFTEADPSINTTILVNIIRTTRAKRELEGKRFCDFFPTYIGEPPPGVDRRPPPFASFEASGIAYPIYCS
jgi:hypothetical protein